VASVHAIVESYLHKVGKGITATMGAETLEIGEPNAPVLAYIVHHGKAGPWDEEGGGCGALGAGANALKAIRSLKEALSKIATRAGIGESELSLEKLLGKSEEEIKKMIESEFGHSPASRAQELLQRAGNTPAFAAVFNHENGETMVFFNPALSKILRNRKVELGELHASVCSDARVNFETVAQLLGHLNAAFGRQEQNWSAGAEPKLVARDGTLIEEITASKVIGELQERDLLIEGITRETRMDGENIVGISTASERYLAREGKRAAQKPVEIALTAETRPVTAKSGDNFTVSVDNKFGTLAPLEVFSLAYAAAHFQNIELNLNGLNPVARLNARRHPLVRAILKVQNNRK
jgi:hypothetical protein